MELPASIHVERERVRGAGCDRGRDGFNAHQTDKCRQRLARVLQNDIHGQGRGRRQALYQHRVLIESALEQSAGEGDNGMDRAARDGDRCKQLPDNRVKPALQPYERDRARNEWETTGDETRETSIRALSESKRAKTYLLPPPAGSYQRPGCRPRSWRLLPPKLSSTCPRYQTEHS